MKKGKAAIGILVFAAVLLAALAVGVNLVSPAPGIPAEGRLFEVRKGESSRSLGDRLEKEGIVRSSMGFAWAARIQGKAGKLRSGTYRLAPGMNTLAVLDLIVEGKEALQRVTLPEGLTLKETAHLLSDEGIAREDDFLAAARDPKVLADLGIPGPTAEGYLFPDTYFLPQNYGALPALKELVANFRRKIAGIPEAGALNPKALEGKIILASIIEKEYRIPAEAPLIASVFDNRLRIGMGLQSCATVVYVITERLGRPHPDVVYDKDLELRDPYNTYLYRGLPPAPIASPGLIALKAAFEPATSPYLYFRLIDPVVGTHHFSTNFDEHLRAAQLVLKRDSHP